MGGLMSSYPGAQNFSPAPVAQPSPIGKSEGPTQAPFDNNLGPKKF